MKPKTFEKEKFYKFTCVAEYRYNMVEENLFLAKIRFYLNKNYLLMSRKGETDCLGFNKILYVAFVI